MVTALSLGPVRTATPEWPVDVLDVDALARQRVWQPLPFREFIVKIHSRCNLSCDYCYIYEMADDSWRGRPTVMTPEMMVHVADRIAEHVRTHDIPSVDVVLHGGEPLLAGPERIAEFAAGIRQAVDSRCAVRFATQTNGVLLDERHLPALLEHGITVGVSLDGGLESNDRHRRFANGKGSFAQVARGINRLRQEPYRDLFAGILCTVNLDNDPVRTYEELLEFEPPAMNFLLPHGNWSSRPPGRAADATTPYADWLIAIFDRWYGRPERETAIRFFDAIMNLVLGGRGGHESVGLLPITLLVVETDGGIEQVDSLKSAYAGGPETGLNVVDNSFDEALRHPAVVARQIGVEALCQTCLDCPIHKVCGAGLYTHRYRAGTGFLNPSVYCPDLTKIIRHITRRMLADMRQAVGSKP